MPDVVRVKTTDKVAFLPITKVDATLKQVWGVMAQEVPDKDGEIFDYKTSKPLFEEWSANFAEVTKGKSMGNVREMHQLSAVGKLIAMNFDDAALKIEIGAQIVDDEAWAKIESGVYTGFSIGGKNVGKKVYDESVKAVRYTVKPIEVSVVDNPCIPTSTFDYVKTDGAHETRKFTTVIKSMWDVCDFASMLASLKSLHSYMANEALYEGDGSKVPSAMKDWISQGCDLLMALTAEETAELTADKVLSKTAQVPTTEQNQNSGENEMTPEQMKAAVGDALKGDTFKAAIAEAVKSTVDGMGLAKAADVTALTTKLDEIEKTAKESHEIATATAETIAAVAGLPEVPKVAASAHAISKEEDGGGAAPTDPAKATATDLIKAAQKKPVPAHEIEKVQRGA